MEKNTKKKKIILPVVPLRGKVAFPGTVFSFDAGRAATIEAIKKSAAEFGGELLICTQKITDKNDVEAEDMYAAGTIAAVRQSTSLPGGAVRVVAEGKRAVKVKAFTKTDCFYAECAELKIAHGDEVMEEAYFRATRALVADVLIADGKLSKETVAKLELVTDPYEYVNIVMNAMRVRIDVKQAVLEQTDVIEKMKFLEQALNDELEITKIEKRISSAVRQSIERSQKDYYLREQLKAIHGELGDDGKEQDKYREKAEEKHLPGYMREKFLKEVDRLGKMQPSSPEYTVITSYLDQVLDLPWTEETKDTEKLADAAAILNEDHYALEKIKDRICEYLAVLKLTGSMKAPILCFVGPPGVGKTSIARSIARALGRKFVRMSLGGVKDEAEIRGHRRTYIGSMPGRILYAMKSAGTINPVILLDEIDKISSDMRGDPAGALLEVLDPEQNNSFRDRYLEEPYDLSKVLFVTTANTLDTIPAPLLDRMEVIELSGYTLEEKKEIARRYLVPKQLKANGLTEKDAAFSDGAIRKIIEGYTMEAGVRTLERTIGSVCRKIAVSAADAIGKTGATGAANEIGETATENQAKEKHEKVSVTERNVETYLGAPRYSRSELEKKPEVGAAVGLAWTAVGGVTLTVEAAIVKGKGDVRLTGKLGDVMKESAFAALTFIRSHAARYGLDEGLFENSDVHIHIPEGATPKDGPSAGITMATAVLSAFSGLPVKKSVAMTGEITLRGKVLPIGGLKEKALAARRAGIRRVIIPAENKKDLEELPAPIREEMTFLPVTNAEEVFKEAIEGFKTHRAEETKAEKHEPHETRAPMPC